MTWDADRPKGNQPFNVGDEAIAANFAWLEDAIGVDQTFPGTTTTRGRKKGASDTVTNADGLSGLEDGNEIHINDLGGGTQQDGDGVSTHFWPHRYSAAGGGAQLSAWVPLTPPVCDDNTEQTTLEGKLGTNDFGLVAYRNVGSLYAPMLWDGSAFQLIGTPQVDYQQVTVSANTNTASGYGTGPVGSTFSNWDLLESSGSGDEFHLTMTLPDLTGFTVRLHVEGFLWVAATNGDWYGFGVTEEVDAGGEADLFATNAYIDDGGPEEKRPMALKWSKTFAGTTTQAYEYRIRACRKNAGTDQVLTISPDNANSDNDYVADTDSIFIVRTELVAIT